MKKSWGFSSWISNDLCVVEETKKARHEERNRYKAPRQGERDPPRSPMRPSQGWLYERLFEGLINSTWSPTPNSLEALLTQLVRAWTMSFHIATSLWTAASLKETSEGLGGQKWLISMFSKTLGAGEWKGLFVVYAGEKLDDHHAGKSMHDMVQCDMGYNRHTRHAGLFSVPRPKAIHRLASLQKGKRQWSEAKQILDTPSV